MDRKLAFIALLVLAASLVLISGCTSASSGKDSNGSAVTPGAPDKNAATEKPSCGDGICGSKEKSGEIPCPADCGTGVAGNAKCGDGICDQLEKADPKLCPKDCGSAGDMNYQVLSDLVYATVNGEQLKVDVYMPKEKGTAARPAVFEVHGGAFKGGDKKPSQWGPILAQKGYVVVAVNYRLSGEAIFPAAINDVKAAVRWMRANSGDYDIDDSKFGAIGGSAGGSLVALLGTSGNSDKIDGNVGGYLGYSSSVKAVVDEFGPVNFDTLAQDRADAGMSPSAVESDYLGCDISGTGACENKDLASAVHFIDATDPPFMILHGENDDQIPPKQSQDFYKALVMAGVDANITLIPNAGHGTPQSAFDKYGPQIVAFFEKHLK